MFSFIMILPWLVGNDTLVTESQFQGELNAATIQGTTRANATLVNLKINYLISALCDSSTKRVISR